MPFKIQRVPRGLNDFLSIFGGGTPTEFEDRIQGVLDTTQFYALTQRQFPNGVNAALAEGGAIDLTVPANQYWILYGMSMSCIKTATMTALELALAIGRTAGAGFEFVTCSSRNFSPFGATETGGVNLPYVSPYPRILPPGSVLRAGLGILGTDATANCTFTAEVGVLGQ